METKHQRQERLRKKGICEVCERYITLKAYGKCQNCWHKYKRKHDKRFFLRTRYTEIYQRCNNPKHHDAYRYGGKEVCGKEEFYDKFIDDEVFNRLFTEWQESDFDYKLVPSVDRIKVEGGYTLDNIQMLPHAENSRKDQVTTKIKYYKDGELMGEFISQSEAARQLKVQVANIWKVLNKERKLAGGYYFEYV